MQVTSCTLIHLDAAGYDEQGCYWGVGEPLYWIEYGADKPEDMLRESECPPEALAIVNIPSDDWLYLP